MTDKQRALYIFIDESGNFDFTPTGTKYFVLTSVSTFNPLKSREELLRKVYELKYKGWNTSNEQKADYYFHASEDEQAVRDWVFAEIKKLNDFGIDTILAQKNKTNPTLYINYEGKPNTNGGITFQTIHCEEKFYHKISQILLKYIFQRHENIEQIERIIVVLGSLFTETKRKYIRKGLEEYLAANFKKPFHIYFRPAVSEINCQIADYCGWAVYVRAERAETRPWEKIEDKIKSHFDVFASGSNEYYGYKN